MTRSARPKSRYQKENSTAVRISEKPTWALQHPRTRHPEALISSADPRLRTSSTDPIFGFEPVELDGQDGHPLRQGKVNGAWRYRRAEAPKNPAAVRVLIRGGFSLPPSRGGDGRARLGHASIRTIHFSNANCAKSRWNKSLDPMNHHGLPVPFLLPRPASIFLDAHTLRPLSVSPSLASWGCSAHSSLFPTYATVIWDTTCMRVCGG